jgi:Domain of unknown function (DUF4276)
VRRIHILVEGQTEEIVVRDVIAPALVPGIWLEPVLLTTKRLAGGPSFKGGVSSWKKIERDIRLLLRDSSVSHVTTLLDYYGLPNDCPGVSTCPLGSPYERVAHVEEQMRLAIGESRFMPHLVLHETETWVFAAAQQLGELLGDTALAATLTRQVAKAGHNPELINDGPATAPSKRLLAAYPGYNKTQDGPLAIAALGLADLRSQCPHLDEWLRRLCEEQADATE